MLSHSEDQTMHIVHIQKIGEFSLYAKVMCHWIPDPFSRVSYGGLIIAHSMLVKQYIKRLVGMSSDIEFHCYIEYSLLTNMNLCIKLENLSY